VAGARCSKRGILVVISAASCGSEHARLAVVSITAVVPALLLGVDVKEKIVDGVAGAQTLFAVVIAESVEQREESYRSGRPENSEARTCASESTVVLEV